ncbi:alternative ribosome rescue aminoacyl-tRNA hydrolase ArfB [Flavobacterium cerinum]|uniref:Aminoacyl-tRNA hydrolase n=1 Tax=Flavobacterium cerinum TaxID=2502784 RepID=A0ABY5IUW7_9FLAO|nr:alternative ribosome rescue aminoacyl-tRNA hydrolase ArfB [Flavobacterium cerinum]UUC46620.1 aminoacyl-tRNA hydrolase [Flavobacterium cerinum]
MKKEILFSELRYKAVRSSGAGGQHVNKVATKIQLLFDVANSAAFTEEEKSTVINKLANRLTKDGVLLLSCGESRSQLKNKEIVTARFLMLLQQAMQVDKERKATKIPHAAVKKRIQNKRVQAQKKESRRKPNVD